MNKEIDQNISKLKEDLLKESCVVEYLRLKDLILKDKDIEEINAKMKFLKKCKMNDEELLEYDNLKLKLDTYPIIVNFRETEKEVMNLLKDIKEELEK